MPSPRPGSVATTVDKGHGRVERRTPRTTSILTRPEMWAGLKQGFELVRERTVRGVTSVEVVYGSTSLSPERADAARLLSVIRDHRRIENGVHDVRDVTPGEDRCRVRSGSAPQVLAALRNAAVHLLSGVASPEPSGRDRGLATPPDAAQRLIGIPRRE